jgi:hypothetical protein
MFIISMRIPNRHFHTWNIAVLPPVAFPAATRLFPNPERLQPPDSVPAASRSAVYTVRWRMHSISSSTRNNYISPNPIARFNPQFL